MKGIYILIIQFNKNVNVTVGKLGKLPFQKGIYAYVGSAQTNLEKRIQRHQRKEKQTFWHIDYLLQSPNSKIVKVFYKTAEKTEECKSQNKSLLKANLLQVLAVQTATAEATYSTYKITTFCENPCKNTSHLILQQFLEFIHFSRVHDIFCSCPSTPCLSNTQLQIMKMGSAV